MFTTVYNFFQFHFKVEPRDPLERYNATCKIIEADANYRVEFSNDDLYDLLFKKGKVKDKSFASKQATVITDTAYTNEAGKFYQIKYTTWYSMNDICSSRDAMYPAVNDRYLIFVSKTNGSVLFYEASNIADNNYRNPRRDLQLHQFLNQECLLPSLRAATLKV